MDYITGHARLHTQKISPSITTWCELHSKQFHLQSKHLICPSKSEDSNESLPITKHRDKWMGEYFDMGEFWSSLKNLNTTSLNGRFNDKF